MLAPVVIIGIDVGAVDVVQLVGFVVVGREQTDGALGEGVQVRVELGYPALLVAEGEPCVARFL